MSLTSPARCPGDAVRLATSQPLTLTVRWTRNVDPSPRRGEGNAVAAHETGPGTALTSPLRTGEAPGEGFAALAGSCGVATLHLMYAGSQWGGASLGVKRGI